MKCDKFYIIAMAASGKSTFAASNPVYNGYKTVDYAEHLPPISPSTKLVLYASRLIKPLRKTIRNRPEMVARRRNQYFSEVFEFTANYPGPVAVFGRKPPDDFERLAVHNTIKFAMVLIPEEEHRRNCFSRKKELRNPLPLFHHWTTDFEKIMKLRNRLSDFANQHGITVYDSFSGAIDDMHRRFNSG